jgi:NADPH:quinone reductase-like Zn-dependent oxidoreductase
VKACSLNYLDVWIRRGLPGLKFSTPHVLGADIAGVVVQVGRLVKNVKPDQSVVLSPGLSCMHCEYCLSGRDNLCASYDVFGSRVDGGYAEYVKSPSFNVIAKPEKLSFEEASSIPLVFLTAWHMLGW